MIEVIAQFETPPDERTYPHVLGVEGLALVVAWQRIEHYIAHRFCPRQVTWLLESDGGDWTLPLRPATDVTAGIWTGEGYSPVTLARAPGGWCIPAGRLEVRATVGDAVMPWAVEAAVKRLAEYMALDEVNPSPLPIPAGVRSYSVNIGSSLSESYTADPARAARALQNSGAADLLRPYRRVC